VLITEDQLDDNFQNVALLAPCICNKLQRIIERGSHITDMSKLTFNDYRDGGLAKHKIQLKSTMGNVVRDA